MLISQFCQYFCPLYPHFNNPISTTYPISNPTTQPSAEFCSKPLCPNLYYTKNPGTRTAAKAALTSGNPLFPTHFQLFISLPVTSNSRPQHAPFV